MPSILSKEQTKTTKKDRERYQNPFEEEKEKKREYGRKRWKKISLKMKGKG